MTPLLTDQRSEAEKFLDHIDACMAEMDARRDEFEQLRKANAILASASKTLTEAVEAYHEAGEMAL